MLPKLSPPLSSALVYIDFNPQLKLNLIVKRKIYEYLYAPRVNWCNEGYQRDNDEGRIIFIASTEIFAAIKKQNGSFIFQISKSNFELYIFQWDQVYENNS